MLLDRLHNEPGEREHKQATELNHVSLLVFLEIVIIRVTLIAFITIVVHVDIIIDRAGRS